MSNRKKKNGVDFASEFERLAFEAESQRTAEQHSRVKEIQDHKFKVWFLALSFVGVIARLLGIVEYDFGNSGFEDIGFPELKNTIGISVKALYLIISGAGPDNALKFVAQQKRINRELIADILVSMIHDFESDGSKIPIDVGILFEVEPIEEPEVLERPTRAFVTTTGVSRPDDSWCDPLFDQEGPIFEEALANLFEMPVTEAAGKVVEKFVSCECFFERKKNGEYPFSEVKSTCEKPAYEDEMERVAEVMKPLLRLMLGEDYCHLCGEYYRRLERLVRPLRDRKENERLLLGAGSLGNLNHEVPGLRYLLGVDGVLPKFKFKRTRRSLKTCVVPERREVFEPCQWRYARGVHDPVVEPEDHVAKPSVEPGGSVKTAPEGGTDRWSFI